MKRGRRGKSSTTASGDHRPKRNSPRNPCLKDWRSIDLREPNLVDAAPIQVLLVGRGVLCPPDDPLL